MSSCTTLRTLFIAAGDLEGYQAACGPLTANLVERGLGLALPTCVKYHILTANAITNDAFSRWADLTDDQRLPQLLVDAASLYVSWGPTQTHTTTITKQKTQSKVGRPIFDIPPVFATCVRLATDNLERSQAWARATVAWCRAMPASLSTIAIRNLVSDAELFSNVSDHIARHHHRLANIVDHLELLQHAVLIKRRSSHNGKIGDVGHLRHTHFIAPNIDSDAVRKRYHAVWDTTMDAGAQVLRLLHVSWDVAGKKGGDCTFHGDNMMQLGQWRIRVDHGRLKATKVTGAAEEDELAGDEEEEEDNEKELAAGDDKDDEEEEDLGEAGMSWGDGGFDDDDNVDPGNYHESDEELQAENAKSLVDRMSPLQSRAPRLSLKLSKSSSSPTDPKAALPASPQKTQTIDYSSDDEALRPKPKPRRRKRDSESSDDEDQVLVGKRGRTSELESLGRAPPQQKKQRMPATPRPKKIIDRKTSECVQPQFVVTKRPYLPIGPESSQSSQEQQHVIVSPVASASSTNKKRRRTTESSPATKKARTTLLTPKSPTPIAVLPIVPPSNLDPQAADLYVRLRHVLGTTTNVDIDPARLQRSTTTTTTFIDACRLFVDQQESLFGMVEAIRRCRVCGIGEETPVLVPTLHLEADVLGWKPCIDFDHDIVSQVVSRKSGLHVSTHLWSCHLGAKSLLAFFFSGGHVQQ